MPQLDISTYSSQVFWLVVCFGILCVFMATMIAPRIGLSLHQRAKVLEEHSMAAKKLLEEAEILRDKSIHQLGQARHDAAQQLHQALHDLSHYRTEKVREFDQKLQVRLLELSKSLSQQKQEILSTSQDLVTHLVETVFHKITNVAATSEDITKALKIVKTRGNHD